MNITTLIIQRGPAGVNGTNGTNGTNGINGTNGPAGAQGPAGSDATAAALTCAGADPNYPETLTVTGITANYDGDPVVGDLALVKNVGLTNGKPSYSTADTFSNLYFNGSEFEFQVNDGSSSFLSDAVEWLALATWTAQGAATGYPVLVSPSSGIYLGQLCKADTAWWYWNGSEWIPDNLLTGEPIMGAPGAYFSLGRDGDGAAAFTPFPNI